MYSHPFDLVVSDLWGPTLVNYRPSWYYVFLLMFVADLLGYFLFKRNLKQLTVLFSFRNWCRLSFAKISSNFKVTRGEFHSFTFLLTHNGIIFRVTCPHTSEQNGIVKRKHWHIVEIGLHYLFKPICHLNIGAMPSLVLFI